MDEKALGEFVEAFRRGGGPATEPAGRDALNDLETRTKARERRVAVRTPFGRVAALC